MKSYFLLSLLSICFLGQAACAAEDSDTVITVGTFNVEWLGDGDSLDVKPRSEEDYKNVASIIRQTEADVLGIEEIENVAALQRVLRYLPEYKYYLGTKGHLQNVGVLYKEGVEISETSDYLPLATRPERNRAGFVFHCRKKEFTALCMVVHLKSTSRADSTKELKLESYVNRREQIHVLCTWIDSLVQSGQKNVMVLGDCNDFVQRQQNPTLGELIADSNVVMLTAEQHSCKNPNWFGIDHIITTKHLSKRWHPTSLHNVNIYASLTKKEAEGVSDHCPVVTQFDCTKKADSN